MKLGGDKGRGSVKMNVQVVNVKNPNSIKNTALFAVFEGDDSIVNLHTILDPYKEQIHEMQGMDWGLVIHIVHIRSHVTVHFTNCIEARKSEFFFLGTTTSLQRCMDCQGHLVCITDINNIILIEQSLFYRETLLPMVFNPC